MNKESNNKISNTDLLVIGSGIAGCTTALEAADLGKKVILLSSALNPLDSNSYLAQGGIIYKAKNEPNESNLLSADIQRAGAGKCDLNAVTKLTQEVCVLKLSSKINTIYVYDQHLYINMYCIRVLKLLTNCC